MRERGRAGAKATAPAVWGGREHCNRIHCFRFSSRRVGLGRQSGQASGSLAWTTARRELIDGRCTAPPLLYSTRLYSLLCHRFLFFAVWLLDSHTTHAHSTLRTGLSTLPGFALFDLCKNGQLWAVHGASARFVSQIAKLNSNAANVDSKTSLVCRRAGARRNSKRTATATHSELELSLASARLQEYECLVRVRNFQD